MHSPLQMQLASPWPSRSPSPSTVSKEWPQHEDPQRFKGCCRLLCPLLILVLIGAVVSYIILRPHSFDLYVTQAKLTKFSYNSNTLRYNLTLNAIIHNPNKLDLCFDKVEVSAFYQRLRFVTTSLRAPRFSSVFVNTDDMVHLRLVFLGRQAMPALDVNEFQQEARGGVFGISVELQFDVRFGVGRTIMANTKAVAKCQIKVPLATFSDVSSFETTQCLVVLYD